jgi:hypothetical protein
LTPSAADCFGAQPVTRTARLGTAPEPWQAVLQGSGRNTSLNCSPANAAMRPGLRPSALSRGPGLDAGVSMRVPGEVSGLWSVMAGGSGAPSPLVRALRVRWCAVAAHELRNNKGRPCWHAPPCTRLRRRGCGPPVSLLVLAGGISVERGCCLNREPEARAGPPWLTPAARQALRESALARWGSVR